jgi:hypothetical protein
MYIAGPDSRVPLFAVGKLWSMMAVSWKPSILIDTDLINSTNIMKDLNENIQEYRNNR